VIKKDKLAVKRGLIALIGAYLLTASVPGLNAVSVTAFFLNNQFRQILEVNEMLDDDNQIIHQDTLEASVYESLMQSVDQMAPLGLSRFPLIPEGYVHPEDFDTTFGFKEIDPVEPNGETLSYNLNFGLIDLSGFDYESLMYVNLPGSLEEDFIGDGLSLSYIDNSENHEYLFTVTKNAVAETIDLYEDVAVVLFERHEENTYETEVMEELKVTMTFETFVIDIWVVSLMSEQFETFNGFSIIFYIGINALPI
jgi:hypothetical protein